MNPLRSLRSKILLSALVPMVLILAAVAVIAADAYERIARDVVEQRDTELAKVSAARLSDALSRHTLALETIAVDAEVRSLDANRVGAAIRGFESRLRAFDAGVAVYDSLGAVVWSQSAAVPPSGTEAAAPPEIVGHGDDEHPEAVPGAGGQKEGEEARG